MDKQIPSTVYFFVGCAFVLGSLKIVISLSTIFIYGGYHWQLYKS